MSTFGLASHFPRSRGPVLTATCLLLAAFSGAIAHGEESPAVAALRAAGAKITLTKEAVTACDIPDCSSEKFSADNWQHLAKLADLERLSFGAGLTDDMLAGLPVFAKLTAFQTNAMQVTDEGLKPLAKQARLSSVAFFHPPKHFTGKGFVHLAPLAGLQRLTVAGSLAFGDEGLAAVAQLGQLRHFRTWHAGGTDAGLEKLAALPLESLVLGQRLSYQTPACPADASLEILLKFKSLQTLDLQEARFSPAALTKLKGLGGLKSLKLTGVELSPDDLALVKQQLSGVEVTWTEPSAAFQKRIKALFDGQ